MTTIFQAFTNKYNGLANRLITPVTVAYNGKEVNINALWDTGATRTNISKEVVQQLDLIPTGKINIQTAGGSIPSSTYLVNVSLPNHVVIQDIEVCDSEIGKQGLGMLVGMDIISRGDFVISAFGDKTTFSYRIPSKKKYDFVVESNMDNAITKKKSKVNPTSRKKKR